MFELSSTLWYIIIFLCPWAFVDYFSDNLIPTNCGKLALNIVLLMMVLYILYIYIDASTSAVLMALSVEYFE